jgi:putative hydrolase of the HAD superfamily
LPPTDGRQLPLLLLDLDDTLIDRAGAFGRLAEGFLREQGLFTPERLAHLVAMDDYGRFRRRAYLAWMVEHLGLETALDEVLAGYEIDFIAQLGPAAPATLAALEGARARGWAIGVVTNGDHLQERKIRQAGLERYIDGLIASDLVGHQKPDPEIFRIAARQLGGTLDGAWMVGDLASTDIAGAVAAGISSVWIHHGRQWYEPGFQPTLMAGSAAEAVCLVLDGRGRPE